MDDAQHHVDRQQNRDQAERNVVSVSHQYREAVAKCWRLSATLRMVAEERGSGSGNLLKQAPNLGRGECAAVLAVQHAADALQC